MFSTFVGLGRLISCQRPDYPRDSGGKQGKKRTRILKNPERNAIVNYQLNTESKGNGARV